MPNPPNFDLAEAHRYFAVSCFNRTWELINRPDRTTAEDEEMIRLSLASLWHWTQHPDCTATNRAIGCWQVARVYTLAGQLENAGRYGHLALEASLEEGVEPVYQGYAYEALARAEAAAGAREQSAAYLELAHQAAARTTDPEDRQQLLDDLDTVHP